MAEICEKAVARPRHANLAVLGECWGSTVPHSTQGFSQGSRTSRVFRVWCLQSSERRGGARPKSRCTRGGIERPSTPPRAAAADVL